MLARLVGAGACSTNEASQTQNVDETWAVLPNIQRIGEALRAVLCNKKSQKNVAQLFGVSEASMSRWMSKVPSGMTKTPREQDDGMCVTFFHLILRCVHRSHHWRMELIIIRLCYSCLYLFYHNAMSQPT